MIFQTSGWLDRNSCVLLPIISIVVKTNEIRVCNINSPYASHSFRQAVRKRGLWVPTGLTLRVPIDLIMSAGGRK